MRFLIVILALISGTTAANAFEIDTRSRLLVLTYIGGEPDDQQSLVRLLVHANEFKIEGLIASASGTPGDLKQSVVKPALIHEQVDDYEKVFATLNAVVRPSVKEGTPRDLSSSSMQHTSHRNIRWTSLSGGTNRSRAILLGRSK